MIYYLLIPLALLGAALFIILSPTALYHLSCFFSASFNDKSEANEAKLENMLDMLRTEMSRAISIIRTIEKYPKITAKTKNSIVKSWKTDGVYMYPVKNELAFYLRTYYLANAPTPIKQSVLYRYEAHQVAKVFKQMARAAASKGLSISFFWGCKVGRRPPASFLIQKVDRRIEAATMQNITACADNGSSIT